MAMGAGDFFGCLHTSPPEEEDADRTLKRTVKDSVFTDLFGRKTCRVI